MACIQGTELQLHFARTNNALFVVVVTNKVKMNVVNLINTFNSFFFLTDFV